MNRSINGRWVSVSCVLVLGLGGCVMETVSCPEGTSIPDFEDGGRECVPDEGAGGVGGEGGEGGMGGAGGVGGGDLCLIEVCESPRAARCVSRGSPICQPCEVDFDCEGNVGGPVCEDGVCVECRPAGEDEYCGENSCNPETFECTETPRESLGECEACVTDSECQEDFLCVPMNFEDEPLPGGFCLQRAGSQCERPFAFQLEGIRESVNGEGEGLYCGVDEERVTCSAVLDALAVTECEVDADCGTSGGGLCREIGLLGRICTYECLDAGTCPEGGTFATCGDGGGVSDESFCGG